MINIDFNKINSTTQMDLVDPFDNIIGEALKTDIYKAGVNNYRVVNVFLTNDKGELLILKRSAEQSIFPNCYDFSCGKHVFSGETYELSAIRGLKEELGLDIDQEELIEIGYFKPNQTSSFCKLFKVTSNSIPDYDKVGFTSAEYMSIQNLKKIANKTPEAFKGDLLKIIRLL